MIMLAESALASETSAKENNTTVGGDRIGGEVNHQNQQQHSNNTTSSSAKARQLTQPMVCAQIYVEKPEDKFTIEFVFSEVETRRDRRRVVLSTAFLETKTSPLHCQVPIVAKKRRATKSVSVKSAVVPNKKKNHKNK